MKFHTVQWINASPHPLSRAKLKANPNKRVLQCFQNEFSFKPINLRKNEIPHFWSCYKECICTCTCCPNSAHTLGVVRSWGQDSDCSFSCVFDSIEITPSGMKTTPWRFHCEVISLGAAQFTVSVLTAYCVNGILSPEKTLYFTSEVVGRSCNRGVKWLST